MDSCCYGRRRCSERTCLVLSIVVAAWDSCCNGTKDLSMPRIGSSYIHKMKKSKKKLKPLKNPHSTHPSTRKGSVWPAALKVSKLTLGCCLCGFLFLLAIFFLAHKIQKHQKTVWKPLKIPSPSILRLGNPHRATAWDSCWRGLGPRFEAHTGCDLDGFPIYLFFFFFHSSEFRSLEF